MKKYLQNHPIRIWLSIQVFLLFLLLCNAWIQGSSTFTPIHVDPLNHYYMTMGTYQEAANGYYVDESSGSEGIFTCGPYLSLPKGIYDITIYYESTGSGHTCYAFSEDSEYFASDLSRDKFSLDEHHTSKTFRIKVNRNCNDFEVRTCYGGTGTLLVKGFTVNRSSINTIHTLLLQLLGIFLFNMVALFLYLIKTGKISRAQIGTVFALGAIVLFASVPLTKGGFPRYTTDLNFILMRIEGLKDGLLSGNFPVRIQPNWLNGYGYATSIFYSDLFLYFPALLRMAGVSVQNAYFAYQFSMNVITCLLAYYCFSGIFRNRMIALTGTALYTLSSYRLLLLYYTTRGGMFTAYAFLPLILYGVYLIYTDSDNHKSWLFTALGMTAILRCHLLSAEMVVLTLVLLILFTVTRFFRRTPLFAMIKAVLAALFLNIGFFVPMLDYMGDGFYVSSEAWKRIYNYIQVEGLDLSGFLNIFRGVDSYHAPDMILITGLLLFLVLLVLVPGADLSETGRFYRSTGAIGFLLSLILCYMSTRYFPWDTLEESFEFLRMPVNSIQYPHRFIEIATLTMTFTVCCGLMIVKEKISKENFKHALLGLYTLLFITSGWMLSSILNLDTYQSVYDAAYLDTCRISTKEYLPEGADPDDYTRETPIAETGIAITSFQRNGLHLTLTCDNQSGKDSLIDLPLVYYNGYQALTEDGTALTVWAGGNYTVQVVVPQNYLGQITIGFQEPISWTISWWISLFSALLILLWKTIEFLRSKHHPQPE